MIQKSDREVGMGPQGKPGPPARSLDPAVVYQELYPALWRLALSLVRPPDAEDLVQQTIVEVLSRYPRFAGLQLPLAYAKVVMIRRVHRSRKRRRITEEPLGLETLNASEADSAAEDWISRADLAAALHELPPRQRVCVYLRIVEDLDSEQIAAAVGIKPATVRSLLARAFKALAANTNLQNWEKDHGYGTV